MYENIYEIILASHSMSEYIQGSPSDSFRLVSNPKFFYASEKHTTGLSYLQHGVAEKKGLIVLTGYHGVGKTLLVNTLIQQFITRVRVASFSGFDLSLTNFYKSLCEKFEIDTNIATDHSIDYKLLNKLKNFSVKCNSNDQYCVVIIDESQSLPHDFSHKLTAISNLGTDKENLIQIVLVGGIELHDKLNLPEFAKLKQRIGVNYTLLPLNASETEGYINTRLAASGTEKSPFTGDAISAIYQYSRGVPRVINSLCDFALFIGSQDREQEITSPVVIQAAQMLDIQAPEAPTVRQGAQAFDADHMDTISVRRRRLQEKSVPQCPLLADFPRLLEDEEGTGWRIPRRLITIGLVTGVIVGLMCGIGAWQRHHTETILHDQSSAFISSVEGLEPQQYQTVDVPVPLNTVPSTQNATTISTAPGDFPAPLPGHKVVIVQENDTLWKIIQREYSDPHRRLIALVRAANPEITNPSRIGVGQRILLPMHSQ
jgi:type II secretory pathway predicted ATPase ExeA